MLHSNLTKEKRAINHWLYWLYWREKTTSLL